MRYSCGPASSYAARSVDVPKGLRTNMTSIQDVGGASRAPFQPHLENIMCIAMKYAAHAKS